MGFGDEDGEDEVLMGGGGERGKADWLRGLGCHYEEEVTVTLAHVSSYDHRIAKLCGTMTHLSQFTRKWCFVEKPSWQES